MTLSTLDQAPIYPLMRHLKAALPEERFASIHRELVNASLAVAKHHFSLLYSHQLQLSCQVAAAVISVGIREQKLDVTEVAFFNNHAAPIKYLFRVGWNQISKIFKDIERLKKAEFKDLKIEDDVSQKIIIDGMVRDQQRNFLIEIKADINQQWNFDNIAYYNIKDIEEKIAYNQQSEQDFLQTEIVGTDTSYPEDCYDDFIASRKITNLKNQQNFIRFFDAINQELIELSINKKTQEILNLAQTKQQAKWLQSYIRFMRKKGFDLPPIIE